MCGEEFEDNFVRITYKLSEAKWSLTPERPKSFSRKEM